MGDSVGSGVQRSPPCRPFPYLSRKPNPTGERGVRSAECDRTRWVTVVSTLGAWTEESSSPPSSPSSCCHYMTSGSFGLEVISYAFFKGKPIFCFLPTRLLFQSPDLSACRCLGTEWTKWSLLSPSGCDSGILYRTGIGIVRL